MSRTRRFGARHFISGLIAMSMLACTPGEDESVADGEACSRIDQCEGGSICYEDICRRVCNGHQECAKTEACQTGVCMSVSRYECDEDADCTEPRWCQRTGGAECYAGKCHYQASEAGVRCDDDNPCTSNDRCGSTGTCSGEAIACDTPPANFCVDESTYRQFESTGTCNSTDGSCEYTHDDVDCDDCKHECLGLAHSPANLVAAAGDRKVTLTWELVDGALSYNVYVSQTESETHSAVPVSTTDSSYEYLGLSNGTTYYLAVSAVVEAGEGDLSVVVWAMPRISAPTLVSAQGGDQRVIVTWDAVEGADTYNLYWDEAAGLSTDSNRIADLSSPFVHESISNNSTYHYAVTAVDGPSESALSGEASAKTLIDAGAKLLASDAEGYEQFGTSVAISGDYAIVGAPYEDGPDNDLPNAGAAYLFQRNADGTWEAGTKLLAADAGEDDQFGHSVAISGDYAIVGAPHNLAYFWFLGAAYLFHRNADGTWDAGTKLLAPDDQEGCEFGHSVAISGDHAIVGGPYEYGSDKTLSGAAHLFQRNADGTWDAGTKLLASDAQGDDQFGPSVAISGDYAIVGAPYEDGPDNTLTNAGAAYLFQRNADGTWDAGTKLLAPDAQEGYEFGHSVAISGDYAIVGAPYAPYEYGPDSTLTNAGAAYLFQRNADDTWDIVTKLLAPDAQEGYEFGHSVAISGDYAIVGAPYEYGLDNTSSGAAYLFQRNTDDTWGAGTKLLAPDAHADAEFGHSVAISGNYTIVGAPYEDGPFYTWSGAAYLYEF